MLDMGSSARRQGFLLASTVLLWAARVVTSCGHDHHPGRHALDNLLDLGEDSKMMGITDFDEDEGSLAMSSSSSVMMRRRHLRHHHHHHHTTNKNASSAPACITNDPSAEGDVLMKVAAAARKKTRKSSLQGIVATNYTTNLYSPIKVYWNVIKAGNTPKLGNWNLSMTEYVIAGMNNIYNNTPFSFTLAGMTQTTNSNWFNCTSAVESAYKTKLRVEGADVLNVYLCNFLDATGGYTGFGYYPYGVVYPTSSYLDGVTVFNPFVHPQYGYTLDTLMTTMVHEAGHWLGLKHTFSRNNTCVGDGDYISDTPSHPNASLYLPGADTCFNDGASIPDTCQDNLPGVAPGLDPVFNYMNYGYTDCFMKYGYFTTGQVQWMVDMFEEFRWKKTTCRAKTIGCVLNSNCCSRFCKSGKCNCKAKGAACTLNVNCCSGTCSNKICS